MMNALVTHANAGEPWSGAPSATVTELLYDTCRADPSKPIMIFEDGPTVTRGEFLELTEDFARYLITRVEPGDRVAIILGNRTEFLTAWLATVLCRAVLVSVNPDVREHDLRHILDDSTPVVVICGEEHRDLVEGMRSTVPSLRDVVYVGEDEPHGLPSDKDQPLDRLPLREDDTNIYYTSGTTGAPKGCLTGHEWWLRTVDIELRINPKTPEDRLLCCLPFYYADPGWMLLAALQCGGSLVVMRRFSVSRFWDVVRKHDVSDILSFASMPALLLMAEPSEADKDHKVTRALQVAVTPGLHRQMVDRWGFPWVDGYGITEGNFVTRVPLEYAEEMVGSGSIGVACPEVEIRLVDDDEVDVEVGAVGEFLVKGPGLMSGYLNRPEATAETLKDGWLRTGDLGRMDERGFYYFAGRKKDIIRRNAENLSASQVEDILRSHPQVHDAAVIGVPDDLRGEEVFAYVLLAEDAAPDSLLPQDLTDFCATKLAAYKVPRYVKFRTTDFPRTPSMRVQKSELREQDPEPLLGAWDREAHEGSRPTRPSTT